MKMRRLRQCSSFHTGSGAGRVAALDKMGRQIAVDVGDRRADDAAVARLEAVEHRPDVRVGEIGKAVVVLRRVGARDLDIIAVEHRLFADLAVGDAGLDRLADRAHRFLGEAG